MGRPHSRDCRDRWGAGVRVIGCRNGALGRIGPCDPPDPRPAHLATRLWHRKHDESPSTGTGSSTEGRPVLIGTGKGQRPTEPDLRHEVQTFIRL